MTRIVYKSIDSDSDSLSTLRCSCTSNSGGWGYSHRALEKMFRLQMPNKTAGGMHEETTHSRSAKGVCLGTLPNEPRLNEIKSKICTNHYHMFFYGLLCACAAAFFCCAFFSSSVSTLHSPIACLSESLEHVSICFWCETNQSFQNIPMWTSLFGLGHLLSSLQVVRPSQVHGSSEHSKHSAQFSLEIRFSMGEWY